MRALIALIFFGLAAWLGYSDYNATAAQGEELVLTSADAWWQQVSPATHETYLPKLQEVDVPYLWDPVLQTVLSWPIAALFAGLAFFFFMIRRRSEPKVDIG